MTGDVCCRECGADLSICRGCGRPLPGSPGAPNGLGAALYFEGREFPLCAQCTEARRDPTGIVRTLARVVFTLQQIAKEEITKARARR